MTISGFTFIRNGVTYDYPFVESIRSLLPLVDEMVVAVGDSSDETRDRVASIDPRIKIIDTTWDESLRDGGRILAQQTDIALEKISGDWGIYLQGDEVLHEDDQSIIRKALIQYAQVPIVEGLLFDYLHFYGSYSSVGNSRKWYRREVRAVRNGMGIRSWGDAQGFRKEGRKLKVARIPARIFHYGWVKPPDVQKRKLRSFHRYWHSDDWVEREVPENQTFEYAGGGRLETFSGSHPAVMRERIAAARWDKGPLRAESPIGLRHRFLDILERKTGWRAGEYRNYDCIEEFSARP